MFDISIHSPRQHQQIRQKAETLRLARNAEHGLWQPLVEQQSTSRQMIEISCRDDALEVRAEGFKRLRHSAKSIELELPCTLSVPARFAVGDATFEVVSVGQSFPNRELKPLDLRRATRITDQAQRQGPAPQTLARWFEALATFHRWAAGSQEFYVDAARLAVDPIGLDGALVLRRRAGTWEIAASYLPHPECGVRCDMDQLDRLLVTPTTWFHGKESASEGPTPVKDDHALVISPLFNSTGELAGALYGFRFLHAGNGRRGIRYLEAHLIQLLAESLGCGIARLEREAEGVRKQALIERALAPAVIRELEADTGNLEGQEREVTILFADLRDYSALCQELSPTVASEMTSALLNCMTQAVLDFDGVVIDYYGDGLAAMWNAPAEQPQHSELACRAALQMLARLPDVGKGWIKTWRNELRVGIGIHTGLAQVGNVGTDNRLKYGPRGTAVNLASRVEGATKRLGVPLLVTAATRERLSKQFLSYRVCLAKLTGFEVGVNLYGVRNSTTEERLLEQLNQYEQALGLYEAGKLEEACQLLDCEEAIPEIPTKFLFSQVRNTCCRELGRRRSDQQAKEFDRTIDLSVK